LYKKDWLDVSYSKPKYHMINFYFDDELIHRVFEPSSKRHVFVPMKDDWIEIAGIKFKVIGRKIKYLADNIAAYVYVEELKL
jgi:hypothetical protein